MNQPVVTTYLEMTTPAQLRPAARILPDFHVRRVEIPLPSFNRWLYATVGEPWQWVAKADWTDDQWRIWVDRTALQTWVGYLRGAPAGYYELDHQPGIGVEIAYFGLLPQFLGRGLGGLLLTHAIQRAWAMDAGRVWVHTCSLDHPAALSNYQARGMVIYAETETIPTQP